MTASASRCWSSNKFESIADTHPNNGGVDLLLSWVGAEQAAGEKGGERDVFQALTEQYRWYVGVSKFSFEHENLHAGFFLFKSLAIIFHFSSPPFSVVNYKQ